MTNVDGVAQGYDYRGGYDFPQPRGTATAKLTFDAMDRLRPHVAIAWHNWVAPRDVDCLFYTDSEEGKPSRVRGTCSRSVSHHLVPLAIAGERG